MREYVRPRMSSSRSSPRSLPGLCVHADNLEVLRLVPDASIDLVYVDPPFNTGQRQTRQPLRTVRDEAGDRTGFGGKRYRTESAGPSALLRRRLRRLPRLPRAAPREARRVLAPDRELLLPPRLPRGALLQGPARPDLRARVASSTRSSGPTTTARAPGAAGRPSTTTSSSTRRTPRAYLFDADDVDRIPYMAPGLVGPEKAARGKLPTDTWWHTIVSPTGKEKLGYPTQKPLGILKRIVRASCPPGRGRARLLRRQRHRGRGGARARAALRDRRRERGRAAR